MQDIYVGDLGKGIPLVLVHGFLGSSKMWNPQINFFKNYYRVISPDIPGFGKSNKAKPFDNISSIAKLLLSCLKEKKINKFHLLGHSMGGMIVQEMARIDGNKIMKLICYSTGAIGEMPGRFETIKKSKENLKKKGLRIMANNIARTWFIKADKSKYFNLCIESGKEASFEAVDKALTAFEKWNGINALKNIKNETLIIWGDKDKSYNLEQIIILKENIKNSKLKIFNDCAHNIHLENPEKFNKTIKTFLS